MIHCYKVFIRSNCNPSHRLNADRLKGVEKESNAIGGKVRWTRAGQTISAVLAVLCVAAESVLRASWWLLGRKIKYTILRCSQGLSSYLLKLFIIATIGSICNKD